MRGSVLRRKVSSVQGDNNNPPWPHLATIVVRDVFTPIVVTTLVTTSWVHGKHVTYVGRLLKGSDKVLQWTLGYNQLHNSIHHEKHIQLVSYTHSCVYLQMY